MADERQPPPAGEDEIPEAVARKPGRRSFQLVWVIPIVALLAGAWIALKAVWDQGPNITIQLTSAEGIEAGKTKIRHKAVEIGTVRSVKLSDDNKAAIVTAEMDRQAAKTFLRDDTRFWVVRPRVAGGQISGLTTLLAGSYIGADPGKSEKERRSFTGLEIPPVITSDTPGTQFLLQAPNLGSLDINSPVYYRGVSAGRVVSTELTRDGKLVQVRVFVESPYDKFVNGETRFWNESGVDLTVDASGVKLQTESLIALLLGGIAFETPPGFEAPVAAPETQFALFENRNTAFMPRDTVVLPVIMKFAQTVRGLAVGAPLDFRGIPVGEVRRIDLEFDSASVRFLIVVEANLFPERLRSRYRDPSRSALPELTPQQRIRRFVEHGLRAQLRSANLLTGQQYVGLDFFPKAPKATMDLAKAPPEIPVIAGGFGELQESIQNIAAKLERVPFEQLGQDLRKALASLDVTLKKADLLVGQLSSDVAPELRATLEQARKTLGGAEKALGSDSPLQGDLRETLLEVTKAAESVRALTDYLERHPESLLRGKRSGETKK
ncbi:MAG: MCE family protein [Burkholderiales bacterium]|nr:MCE family protein [Burkholderiales bacterium]